MTKATHISIPKKFDILLNQEILLLQKVKKISKNKLIEIIYNAKFNDSYIRIGNINTLTKINYKKFFTDNGIIKMEKRNKNGQKFMLDTSNYVELSLLMNEYNDQTLKARFASVTKTFNRALSFSYLLNNPLPNVKGNSRIYIRSEQPIDKKRLNEKFEKYFSMPFFLRELLIYNSKFQIKNNDDNPEDDLRKLNMDIIIKDNHTCVKYKKGNKESFLCIFDTKDNTYYSLNDIFLLNFPDIIYSEDKFISKKIIVTDTITFYECLEYFRNKVFISNIDNDTYTLEASEKDLHYFEIMYNGSKKR